MKRTTFRISAPLFDRLERHLFPGDHDEHGAVIAASVAETKHGTRCLAREVILARDGVDYVPGRFGYRALTGEFVARASNHCARERLGYFAVHCHGGQDSVSFSSTDTESHERGYPALLDITNGGPVGALVFARNAVAGEIWTSTGVNKLDSMTVIGLNSRCLYPHLPKPRGICDETYHRQSLMFGAVGQHYLAQSKVGIIGLGGVGSLVNEYLARLGVGEIVAVDFDKVERSNRSRIVNSRCADSCDWLRYSSFRPLRRLGDRLAKQKVRIAERVAKEANPNINFQALVGDVTELNIARAFRDTDFLFLCADSMQSRLVFNALVHQYLIPGIQIGSKVPTNKTTGNLGNVFSAARLILPFRGGGCLLCNELIPAAKLQDEALSPEERHRQRYVEDQLVNAPSVITLNAVGTAQATNDFLFHFLGLFDDTHARLGYLMHYPCERTWRSTECRADTGCLHCDTSSHGVYARGDRASLPCKCKAQPAEGPSFTLFRL
ncbi:MAG: ThiF family adenylyltransferase [Verrucomicrobia bacterium]|nr:ThiF family adenylyltransferase [Verrucomicrobiota bacterium]